MITTEFVPAPSETVSSNGVSASVAWEEITPATAAMWLGHNDRNRTLRRPLITQYADEMTAGRWRLTGDPIRFSGKGRLLDGQHRLHAIVQSQTEHRMLVIRGLEDHAQLAMDTGAKRTAGDALGLKGISYGPVVASVALLILNNGGATRRRRASTLEIAEFVEADPTILWVVSDVLPSLTSIPSTASVVGYAYHRLHQIDPDASATFFYHLASLAALPLGSPILALHRRLTSVAQAKRSSAYRVESIAAIFYAWNAWRRGEDRTIIKLASKADGSMAFPEPK